jgi:hypothetical protein
MPRHGDRSSYFHTFGDLEDVFGKVASTGEYNVLRMFPYRLGGNCNDMFEVAMLEVCAIKNWSPGQWRRKQRPMMSFVWDEWTRVVTGEVVYFFTLDAYLSALLYQGSQQRRDPTSEKI